MQTRLCSLPFNPSQIFTFSEPILNLLEPESDLFLTSLAGAVLVIVIVFMAVTSSGASEMVAVSSLFTFDVYRRYINPKVCLFLTQGPTQTRCRVQPAVAE